MMPRAAKYLLVSLTLAPLPACAGAALDVGQAAEPVTEVEVAVVEPAAEPEPKQEVAVVDPPVKPESKPESDAKSEPVATRNQGYGPYDTLDLVCGSGESKRCDIRERATLPSGAGVIAVATYREGGSDDHLAVQLHDGWYLSEVPDGEELFARSHHTPGGSRFNLKSVLAVGRVGFRIDRRSGSSSFGPGQGNRGSTSRVVVERFECEFAGGKLTCDDGKTVFSKACETPIEGGAEKCKTHGKEPAVF
jgi:hypothetical protein